MPKRRKSIGGGAGGGHFRAGKEAKKTLKYVNPCPSSLVW